MKPTLGNWHANLIRLGHFPTVLCVSDLSLFPIILPGRDFPNLVTAFRSRLIQRLHKLGVPQDRISAEQAAMEVVQIQPTNNKSVLGSMNDFVHDLRWQANRHGFLEAEALENTLSETPMGALKYNYPIEAAATLFGVVVPKPS